MDKPPDFVARGVGKALTATPLCVPAVVSELEGLSRGLRPGEAADAAAIQRSERVAAAAKEALVFLRQRPGPPSLRCVTTRGSTLASTVCTSEDDGQKVGTGIIAFVALSRHFLFPHGFCFTSRLSLNENFYLIQCVFSFCRICSMMIRF